MVWQLAYRHAQACLSARPGAALWESDAMHRRHPLQFFACGRAVAHIAGGGTGERLAHALSIGKLYRADPQFSSLQLAADVSFRGIAGAVGRLPARARAWLGNAIQRYPVPAV